MILLEESNMIGRIFSFSVKQHDNSAIKLIEDIKIYAARNGTKFSFIVIKALREYKEAHIDGQ